MRIGLDVMGGDFAPEATLEGALLAAPLLSETDKIVLVGNQSIIEHFLSKNPSYQSIFEVVPAHEVIEMSEHPTKAISQKPNSSISVGFQLLKQNRIDSFASAGNSGAMLVGSIYSLGTIEGIIRPCTSIELPQEDGSVSLLIDVGTNTDCKPELLYQFGKIGSIYMKNVLNIENPKVALLNIGQEEEKGDIPSRAAYGLMKNSKEFNFIGNIEGRDILRGKTDVIVCDGFSGNVVLKFIESIYRMMQKRNLLDNYFSQLNYELFGGTPVLGVNGIVVIGHGISNKVAVCNMILKSKDIYVAKLDKKIQEEFIEK